MGPAVLLGPLVFRGSRLHHELQHLSFGETVQVIQLRVEEVPELVRALRLPSVPYLVLLHDGEEVARHPGSDAGQHLVAWVQACQQATSASGAS